MTAPEADKLGRRVGVGVVLGVVLYGMIALVTDVRALGEELWNFPLAVFLGALGLSVVNYCARWAKWHYYLKVLGFEVSPKPSAIVFVAGLTMSITPGKVGEVLKSVLLRRSHGLDVARTAPIVFAERLTDLLGLFVIAAFGIGFFDFGRWAFGAVLGLLLLGMAALSSPRIVNVILSLVARFPYGKRVRPRLEDAYDSMRQLIAIRPLCVATLLSTLSWSMEAGAFLWILHTLGGDAEPLLAAFIFSMTTILGAVSFLPGGLGVTEGSMIGALLVFDVFSDEVIATTATYLIRLATLWFAVALGVCGLAAFTRVTKRLPQ